MMKKYISLILVSSFWIFYNFYPILPIGLILVCVYIMVSKKTLWIKSQKKKVIGFVFIGTLFGFLGTGLQLTITNTNHFSKDQVNRPSIQSGVNGGLGIGIEKLQLLLSQGKMTIFKSIDSSRFEEAKQTAQAFIDLPSKNFVGIEDLWGVTDKYTENRKKDIIEKTKEYLMTINETSYLGAQEITLSNTKYMRFYYTVKTNSPLPSGKKAQLLEIITREGNEGISIYEFNFLTHMYYRIQ